MTNRWQAPQLASPPHLLTSFSPASRMACSRDVPAGASMVLPEAPALPNAGLAQTVLEATDLIRQQEEKMLVRLRLDLRHIVDELLKVRTHHPRLRGPPGCSRHVRAASCRRCRGRWLPSSEPQVHAVRAPGGPAHGP